MTRSVHERLLLCPFGTLGDIYPFLSIALELKRRGFAPLIAAAPRYETLISAWGIDFRSVGPAMSDYAPTLGLSGDEITRRLGTERAFLLEGLLFPFLDRWYEDTAKLLGGVQLVVTHPLAIGARLAAERLNIPWLGVALSPLTLLHADNPVVMSDTPHTSRLLHRFGPMGAALHASIVRRATARIARPIESFRSRVGLGSTHGHPLHEGMFSSAGALAMYSPLLGCAPPNFPRPVHMAGFTFFDRAAPGESGVSDEVAAFMRSEPYVVFTLGSVSDELYDGDDFVQVSAAVATELRLRALIVVESSRARRLAALNSRDVLVTSHVPYSEIFGHACAVVHPGGIGTSAQAMRAGCAHLVVPQVGDQFDNAYRLARLNIAKVLPMRRYSAARVSAQLRRLLADPALPGRVERVATAIRNEPDGAVNAADRIEAMVRESRAL